MTRSHLVHRGLGAPSIACAVWFAAIALAGCASPPPPELGKASSTYASAAQNADVNKYASVELYDAKGALDRAESNWKEEKDSEEATHLANLAIERVEIAQTAAAARKSLEEARTLSKQRDKVMLEASQKQVAATKKEAARVKQEAAEREQEMKREMQQMQARETERGLLMTLGDVVFNVGESSLAPGATQKLVPLAQFLKDNPDRQLLVEGYTDNTGSDAFNLDLSQKRAQSVTSFLADLGVTPDRMIATGYGKAYPVASNATPEGRQQNRRVEIVILNPGQQASQRVRAKQ